VDFQSLKEDMNRKLALQQLYKERSVHKEKVGKDLMVDCVE
jgi:hypothetical protein